MNLAFTIVNRRSLALIQCHQESPFWGAVKDKTLFGANSSIVIQYSCETAGKCVISIIKQPSKPVRQPLGHDPLWLDSCAVLWSVPPVLAQSCLFHSALSWSVPLCSSETFSVFQLQLGKFSLQSLVERGRLTYLDRSPHP